MDMCTCLCYYEQGLPYVLPVQLYHHILIEEMHDDDILHTNTHIYVHGCTLYIHVHLDIKEQQ